MNIGIITQPNVKGQIVIPKDIRDSLGINEQTNLNITMLGDAIYIKPVTSVYSKLDDDDYLKILARTRGAWGPASKEEIGREKARRKLELAASARRKKAW
ncbi:MAG: hypothetical protein UY21_C0012G0024 [Microgenomates group bacterium GW2011_GWA1_48_10]|uniref:SpoVT-AbrB domain-containing protein n=1 Tax=Candidatus Gottesmanbacteria bacterium RIFCSPHIGHO2_01_FULL_47_48 TaxID=1798381 RepID=A0A1F6A4K8_9BACT|nr:MAG: hypothetical protein UY21_C0012G0024 [Microgenomates group bacterium GW2011_GWA1_48_10]OGG19645.1 MAG: hypothetical protein A2721_00830 [Candidatus Gottesmanbacteria bacterium RIFCSPHIGHO2_01_FULL_47_48]